MSLMGLEPLHAALRFGLAVSLGAALTGCATERHEALNNRQDRMDYRYNARADRRDLRSDRADARYDRW